MQLTIGMATYLDFEGVYATVQALRLYQDLYECELLVVDNAPQGCPATRRFCEGWGGVARYVHAPQPQGTAAPRARVFAEARGAAVLCLDCHVFLVPGAIARLRELFAGALPGPGPHLFQGPLVYDDLTTVSTHLDPVWGTDGMWGVWATNPWGLDPEAPPISIWAQGLGLFACRKDDWPGFHPGFRGFGGEEGYLHEKFRQRGGSCWCLPWLRWTHRFQEQRDRSIPYALTVDARFRNYLLGHRELGLDATDLVACYQDRLPADVLCNLIREVYP